MIAPMLTTIRRVPATVAVVLFYLVLVACSLLMQDGAVEIAGVVMLVLLLVYCCLRRSRRIEVFLCAAAPGGFGTLLHDITGVSPRWGLVLVPFVLAQLVGIDRAERREHQTATF
jgi:hypothetical protein